MAKEFFENLGETISRTAKDLTDRAGDVYEQQRLRSKIYNEEKQVDKAMAELGRIIYDQYKADAELGEEEIKICENIDQKKHQIAQYNDDLAKLKTKNKRTCPSCGAPVDKEDAFCSQCGASCPTEEVSDADADVIDGIARDITDAAEESVADSVDDSAEAANETSEEKETKEEPDGEEPDGEEPTTEE